MPWSSTVGGEDLDLLPAVTRLRRQRAEEVVVVEGARHRLTRRGHERRVVVRRRLGQHEIGELAAVAVVDAVIDVDVVGVLVVRLLQVVDDELGLLGYLARQ